MPLILLLTFFSHPGKDCKKLRLIALELLQEGLIQIQFGIAEPMEVKQGCCFSMLRDLPEQRRNGACLGEFCLHEGTAFLGKFFFIQLRVSTTGPRK